MFWVQLVILAVSLFMSYRAMNQTHTAPDAQEPKAPVIEEGKPLGVVFGRVKISSGNVYWWGDLRNEEIRK
ncbi:hypothetical protein [Photobacterium sp.]|uniref:hypothetical protein n=1 Tax=Photobacterium sp. TaxID=660 RepID=UPI00299E252E|nr:hypothetical protein [Photobacterium sp.]MDX1301180.1 hypothetical protein [Photobacterium sp.]